MMLVKPDGSPMRSEISAGPSTKPFNRDRGEIIGDLGLGFRISPLARWSDTPIIDEAVKQAMRVFTRKTTNINVIGLKLNEETILIQEYPRQDRIAIVIAVWGRQIGMRQWNWLYHTTVFRIEGKLKEHLVLTGRWRSMLDA